MKTDKNVHILMSDYNYDEHGELSDGGNTKVSTTKNVIEKIFNQRSIIGDILQRQKKLTDKAEEELKR